MTLYRRLVLFTLVAPCAACTNVNDIGGLDPDDTPDAFVDQSVLDHSMLDRAVPDQSAPNEDADVADVRVRDVGPADSSASDVRPEKDAEAGVDGPPGPVFRDEFDGPA